MAMTRVTPGESPDSCSSSWNREAISGPSAFVSQRVAEMNHRVPVCTGMTDPVPIKVPLVWHGIPSIDSRVLQRGDRVGAPDTANSALPNEQFHDVLDARIDGSRAFLSVFLHVAPARATNCAVTAAQRQTLLDLPFEQFDQQAGSGWRPLYTRKSYMEAASSLKHALKSIQPRRVNSTCSRSLPVRCSRSQGGGGGVGECPKTMDWMEKGHSIRKSGLIDWNAFVNANIAFPRHDYAALLKQRSLINREPVMPNQPQVPGWAVGKK